MKNGFYRSDIDGLRGIAISLVIIFHLFPDQFPVGFIGVDIFFVISGYLITNILIQQHTECKSLTDFYRRRILRLVPALITILIAVFIFGWLRLFPSEFLELNKQITAGSLFLSNILLFTQINYFDHAIQAKPLMHLWSLGIEEQFYVLWPIILLLLLRLGSEKKRNIAIAMILIASLCSQHYVNQLNQQAAFYLPAFRFWELLIGTLLASTKFHLSLKKSYVANTLAVTFLLAACVFTANKTTQSLQLLLACLSAALIISSSPQAPVNKLILSNRLLVGLGLLSYSLYLWHWPIISFSYIQSGYQSPDLFTGLILLAQTLMGALLAYYLIERPMRRSTSKHLPLLLGVALLTVCFASWSNTKWHWIKPRSYEFTQATDGYSQYFIKIRRDIDYIPNLMNQRNDLIRAGICRYRILSLEEEQSYRYDNDDCLKIDTNKRNVVVFGDSYADDIYASLKIAYPTINFIQLTGCSFHIDTEEGCRSRTSYLLQLLRHPSVEAAVIANLWRETVARSAPLLHQLKAQPKRLIVFGSGPEFIYPAYLVAGERNNGQTHQDAISKHIDRDAIANTLYAREYFEQHAIQYIDRLTIFCSGDISSSQLPRCELVNGDGEPYLWDFGHLFPAGMQKVARHIKAVNLF